MPTDDLMPDWLTPDWLSAVLDTDVSGVRSDRIGDGLVGLNLRVAIKSQDAGAPSSVVVKLPSLDETSRATGVALRNYEREVKFYDRIASTVDIRVPHCHHGNWNEATGDFVLVLEDMAPAAQGDQVAGCDIETARAAVVELARLHAPRWDDASLYEHEFLQRRSGPEDGVQLAALWEMLLPGFTATYARYLSGEMLRVLEAFGLRLAGWVDGRTGPLTVTHGDYRLDNLLFATPSGGPPITAVDWQTPGHGGPVADLAYFLGAGLLSKDRRAAESELVVAYRMALVDGGVDADADWVWNEYRRNAFGGVIMAVVASQVVGGSERSEAMFAAMATRHLQHCIDLDSLDVID